MLEINPKFAEYVSSQKNKIVDERYPEHSYVLTSATYTLETFL